MELYRRHSAKCKYFPLGRKATKCNCPVWCDGRIDGIRIHESMKTRDWLRAGREMDARIAGHMGQVCDVSEAIEIYLKDCATRGLAESTLTSYKGSLLPLREYFSGGFDLRKITPTHLTDYRRHRAVSLSSQRKELEHIRAFLWFCVHHHWIDKNPAEKIKPPTSDAMPTLPYEREEVAALLDACDKLDNFNTPSVIRARLRAKALVLLLLYSGFRVSDAVALERSRLRPDGRLLVRVMKTRKPLYIKLPKQCMDALAAIPVESEKYFFWSGSADLDTAKKSARRTIACLGKIAGINAHPHRFRDTFAVELLLKGADIRTVQILLGHKSLKTTESHYAPYTSRMQKVVDDALDLLTYD